MTAKATAESIRAIMRRKEKQESLNILTFCTHERYEQQLCKTGHQFYSIETGKRWDTDYGNIPDNYHPISEFPSGVDFDLILSHTTCERLEIAYNMRNEFNIPVLLHTHVLPDVRFDVDTQTENFKQVAGQADTVSFISEYNMKTWGFNKQQASVVEHGMDYEFWNSENIAERQPICLSVVNDWANRDWCCGWNLWNEVIEKYNKPGIPRPDQPPTVRPMVVGKNPGLSEAASSIEELREIYHSSLVFLNTSIHSPVPTVLMEAMACGCAIVSTDNCMIPEIIEHGKNGLLANDAKQLQIYIDRLAADTDLAKELGYNAQQTIKEKYSLSRFLDGWNDLFYQTINNYKG